MRNTVFTIILLLGFLTTHAEEYKSQTFKALNGVNLPYKYLPAPKDGGKYPLVVFLHGVDERGNDNVKQLTHGGAVFANDSLRRRFPAMVIFPQCPVSTFWAYQKDPKLGIGLSLPAKSEQTPVEEALKALIDACATMPNIDPARIYLVGVSMGGMAVFDLAARYPNYFAAAVPICGSISAGRLGGKSQTAWRIFHGASDKLVPPTGSRRAKAELEKAGTKVEYIEYPKVGHGVWYKVFERPDFMEWMFKQRLNAKQ